MKAMNQANTKRRTVVSGAILLCAVFFWTLILIQYGNLHAKAASQVVTWTGYITTEDDHADSLQKDTAYMIDMKMMAESGLGLTFQDAGGNWAFYFFDGTIATNNTNGTGGKWAFNGDGGQLAAWNLVKTQAATSNSKEPVPVKVTGTLDGSTRTNPGPDSDGQSFQTLTINSIQVIPDSQVSLNTTNSAASSGTSNSSGTGNMSMSSTSGSSAALVSSDGTTSTTSGTTSTPSSPVSVPYTGAEEVATPPYWIWIAGVSAVVAILLGRIGRNRKMRK